MAPFIRGPYPTMYVNQPWTIRQYAGFSTAAESNAFYRRNLASGQKGLSVAFDLATHRGYDSDHPRVAGDVGMAGWPSTPILDMRQLFTGIDLGSVSVSMTMNGAVLPILALYVVAAEENRGAAGETGRDHPERHPQRVHGPQHLHLSAHALDADHLRHLRVHEHQDAKVQLDLHLGISHPGGRGDRRPGAGVHLADGVEYIRAGLDAGLDIDKFAPPVVLLGHRHELLHGGRQTARGTPAVGELVKGVQPEVGQIAVTAHAFADPGWSLTAQDVFNNVAHVRGGDGATQGTPSRCTPTPSTRRSRCRRTSPPASPATPSCSAAGVGHHAVDRSMGGSNYVEWLTHQLAQKARPTSPRSRPPAAWRQAIERGMPKLRIEEGGRAHQARIDSGQQPLVGVNKVSGRRGRGDRGLKVENSRCAPKQLEKLVRLRAERDEAAVQAARWPDRAAGSSDGGMENNLMALAIEAARHSATVGEILAGHWRRSTVAIRPRSRRSAYRHEGRSGEQHHAAIDIVKRFADAEDGAVRASWSPRWARTATIEARR